MKTITRLIPVSLLATGLLVLPAGCSPACEDLAAPSRAELDAAAAGAEIEREDDRGNECVVDDDGGWELED